MTLKRNFELQKFKEAIDDALTLKKCIDRTLLKGKRRFYEPVRKNYKIYEEILKLLSEFADKSRELIRIKKILKDSQ